MKITIKVTKKYNDNGRRRIAISVLKAVNDNGVEVTNKVLADRAKVRRVKNGDFIDYIGCEENDGYFSESEFSPLETKSEDQEIEQKINEILEAYRQAKKVLNECGEKIYEFEI